MVALGTTLSSYWIMVNNSWMQWPVGYAMGPDGTFVPTDWNAIIYSPVVVALQTDTEEVQAQILDRIFALRMEQNKTQAVMLTRSTRHAVRSFRIDVLYTTRSKQNPPIGPI